MLVLLFYLGDIMYAISCEKIREIVPVTTLKTVPGAPEFFAGFFNYRGEIVPVLDLCRLIRDQGCVMRLSTRIILADYHGQDGRSHILGLMAERVTETIKKEPGSLISPSVQLKEALYLDKIIMEKGSMIQHINLDLLPDCIAFLPDADNGGKNALRRY